MHTWNRRDLLKDLESHFLTLNWPLFNGPLMRFSPSMATLQLLGGNSETEKGTTGIKYLAEQHNKMALAGLRNKKRLSFKSNALAMGCSPPEAGAGN